MDEAQPIQQAVLVAVAQSGSDIAACNRSLDELARLCETAGGSEFSRIIQIMRAPSSATYIGSGKVKELSAFCKSNQIELIVFDDELSPVQIRNIEKETENVRVIDRTMLILDIFALHAKTGEGKLQVELAQLKYTAPRLIGARQELSRLGGGIGTRGPGESKLEENRRSLKRKVFLLEENLRNLEHNRQTMRASRDQSGIPQVAIVGYTNAGKSTLLNYLTDAGVLSEDKLFATLDPTTRKLTLPDGTPVLITDTVGLINRLPHQLIEAFRSTLMEAQYADVLLVLCDVTDPEMTEHFEVTENLLRDIGAADKPVLYVYNKCDRLDELTLSSLALDRTANHALISAKNGMRINEMLDKLSALIHQGKRSVRLEISLTEQGQLNTLHRYYKVIHTEWTDHSVLVDCELDEKGIGIFGKYIVKEAAVPRIE